MPHCLHHSTPHPCPETPPGPCPTAGNPKPPPHHPLLHTWDPQTSPGPCPTILCSMPRTSNPPQTLLHAWDPHTPQPSTSLSSEASRCKERSDMRKWRVVSALGWGPGCSGAYCTFRITSRTEFLGGVGRGPRHLDPWEWAPGPLGPLERGATGVEGSQTPGSLLPTSCGSFPPGI